VAHKKAKKKGSTPSKAHRALLAWHRFIPHVPHTLWKPATVGKVSPLRWHSDLLFQSWKRSRHCASIQTTQEDTTLWYLYGRMLLIVLNDALCPQMRVTVWLKKKRERRVVKLVRHFQA